MRYGFILLMLFSWCQPAFSQQKQMDYTDPQVQQEALKKAQEMLNNPETKAQLQEAMQDPEMQKRVQQVLQDPEVQKLLQQHNATAGQ